MTNSEKVVEIIKTLEENHINLYHDVTKEEIDKYIKSIPWNKLSKVEFDRDMKRLFALFKDGHTNYFIDQDNSRRRFNKQFDYISKKLYIKDDGKFYKVKTINDIDYKNFVKQFKSLISYETEAWANENIRKMFNLPYIYEMIGVALNNGIKVKAERNGKSQTFNLTELPIEEIRKRYNNVIESYNYKILPNNILYLKYPICQDNKDLPFKNLVKNIEKDYKNKKFDRFILDLRGNNGGNSEILNPFQEFVMKNKLNGVLLIDNGVFSSGRFAVARFKDKCNVTLIGQETGGAAKSYGFNKNLHVEDIGFNCSIRLWDFSDIFCGDTGSIKPDISVVNTPQYREKGIDKVLKTAEETLNFKHNDSESTKEI